MTYDPTAPIQHDGVWRPTLALDGKKFNVVRYWRGVRSWDGGRPVETSGREFCKRREQLTTWASFETAQAFCDNLNKKGKRS